MSVNNQSSSMKRLENENETVKLAANGDGAALARVGTYLQKWVTENEKRSTRDIAEGHAIIEAKRLCIVALALIKDSKRVDTFEMLLLEMIKQTETL